ncbi:hypothetical protein EV421DRAFT_1007256 [Armillaria borealis]|uniref:Uncharacterized protein n=1 Tax=Armillaria borealis TaxID=47425 RepID=A0AA39JBK1_9AGAR|nr:hypothetical protein EV421DRAFT_1007256 [Armillaria borealis]
MLAEGLSTERAARREDRPWRGASQTFRVWISPPQECICRSRHPQTPSASSVLTRDFFASGHGPTWQLSRIRYSQLPLLRLVCWLRRYSRQRETSPRTHSLACIPRLPRMRMPKRRTAVLWVDGLAASTSLWDSGVGRCFCVLVRRTRMTGSIASGGQFFALRLLASFCFADGITGVFLTFKELFWSSLLAYLFFKSELVCPSGSDGFRHIVAAGFRAYIHVFAAVVLRTSSKLCIPCSSN